MRKAATDRDLTGVASYCHALRGSALAVNAARLVEISNQIEGYVSLHQQPDYLALIDRLDLALVEIRQTLTCYRQSLPRNQAA
jgi:HPt (histidine-containing phosphotransfer) domain-containing protein